MPGREISNKSMQDRAYIDNLRNTGRTTRMLFRAMCAVANGKQVVLVSPHASMTHYLQRLLMDAGLEPTTDKVKFLTLPGVRPFTDRPIPRDVRFFYDHAALDRIEIGSPDWAARSCLQDRGVLAE
jgi:hypothetical protein